MTKTRRAAVYAAATVAVAAIFFKTALPIYATNRVNQKLQRLGEYRGSVKGISFHFFRGASQVDGLDLVKENGKVPVPFFSAGKIDLRIHWPSLLRGTIAAEVDVYDMQLNFVAAPKKEEEQTTIHDPAWRKRLEELSPIRIDHFRIHNGEVHFRNFHSDPKIDVFASEIEADASNFTNSRRLSGTLQASVSAKGRLMTKGRFDAHLDVDPFADEPTFKVRSKTELVLPEINDFLRHYLGVEAKDGFVDVYLEGSAADGAFKGYVKPLIQNLNVLQLKKQGLTPEQAVKGVFAKIAAALFKNPETKDLGTRVEISGSFDRPDVNVWGAIGSFVNNAFFKAVLPGFEGAARLRDVAKTRVFAP